MVVKGIPVVIAENRQGFPVRPVEQNAPLMTVAESGFGTPITISDNGAPFIVQGLVPPWVPEGALFAGQPIAGSARYWRSGSPETVRESDAYAPNAAGLWTPFGPNVSRITDLGLYVSEGGRTNGVPNSSGSGAVVGSPGAQPTGWSLASPILGLTREVVSTGMDRNLPFVDIRYSGVATGSGALTMDPMPTTAGATTSIGQEWTASIFAALVAGTAPAYIGLGIIERNVSDAALDVSPVGMTLTSDLQRFTYTRTLSHPDVAKVTSYFRPNIVNGQPYDFTIRMAVPQLELGPFATSPIITAGSPATRAADTVTITAPAGTYDLHLLLSDSSEEVIPGWTPDDPLPLDLPQGRFIVEYWGMEA